MTVGRPHHGDDAGRDHALHLVGSVHAGIVGRRRTNGKTKFPVKAHAEFRFPWRTPSPKNRGCAMIGFSIAGCLDLVHYLIVAALALVFLFWAALVALSCIRIVNMTVFDVDERAAGRTPPGRDFGWELLVDDIQWRRMMIQGEKQTDVTSPECAARCGTASFFKSR